MVYEVFESLCISDIVLDYTKITLNTTIKYNQLVFQKLIISDK